MTRPDQTVRVPREPDAGLMSVISAMVRRIAVAVSVEDDEVYFDNGHARQIYKAITDAAAPSPEAEGEGERTVMVCPQCEGEGEYADGVDEAACSTPCTRCLGNGWLVVLASLQRPQTTAMLPGVETLGHSAAFGVNVRTDSGLVDRLVEAEQHLAGLCDAYRLICDDVGRRYYESPASKYAHAQVFLARKGAA